MNSESSRLVPERSLPEYGYVPGHWPHPENDPDGHSFEEEHEIDQPLNPEQWSECTDYLYGIDLFNHGYYWEAHESWEQLWHAAGRTGTTADFLRALIKLAAAGVKVRQGNERGITRHARNARDEFKQLLENMDTTSFAGLSIEELRGYAEQIQERIDTFASDPEAHRERVFSFQLRPDPQR